MSGGTAVQTERHGRGAGAGEAEPRAMVFARSQSEGLGLDGGRACKAPNKKSSVSRSRLTENAQGMEAVWPRPQAGSVHDSPTQRVARRSYVVTEWEWFGTDFRDCGQYFAYIIGKTQGDRKAITVDTRVEI